MKPRLIAEGSTKHERKILRWGISFLVGDVLFDAFGREDIFQENVRRFKIDLSRVKQTASRQDFPAFRKFFHALLQDGVYFAPSAFETNFVSVAHTKKDLQSTLQAVRAAFKKTHDR